MKISYHRRRKIKARRIALRDLISKGIDNPKELAIKLDLIFRIAYPVIFLIVIYFFWL